ncbi:unnamed protein product [Sympodiomycopsis kandeliae]
MPGSYASFQQQLPPTAPSHSTACHLTNPSASSTSYPSTRGTLLSHLVTARDDTIQIWEVRSPPVVPEAYRASNTASTSSSSSSPQSTPRLHHLKTKTLFGITTGVQATRTIDSDTDGKDRLLVSFKDAKIALLEWDELSQDLATLSIHTYERSPQLMHGLPSTFRPILSLDPAHRCAALSLPHDALAILPFTSSSDLDLLDEADDFEEEYHMGSNNRRLRMQGQDRSRMPYTPSFVLSLTDVDEGIRNVRDVIFLPNFQRPTVAVLCESEKQTWTSSLMVHRDTMHLYVFTLDMSSETHPVLSHVEDLPYDAMYLKACQSIGGIFVVTPTDLIHVDSNGKLVGLRVNSWSERITTNDKVLSFPEWSLAKDRDHSMDLRNSHLLWTEELKVPVGTSERRAEASKPPAGSGLVLLNDGRVFSLRCTLDGRTLSSFDIDQVDPSEECDRLLAPPSLVLAIPQHADIVQSGAQLFVGSMLGTSRLLSLEATAVQETKSSENGKLNGTVSNGDMDVDLDDDADLYGDSAYPSATSQGPNIYASKATTRLMFSYSTIDTQPCIGPMSDLALAVIQDKDHNDVVKTIATHGVAPEGGFVHFEQEIQPRNRTTLWEDSQASKIWNVAPSVFVAQAQAGAYIFTVNSQGDSEQIAMLEDTVLDAKQITKQHFVVASQSKIALYDVGQLHGGSTRPIVFEADAPISSISTPASSELERSSVVLVALFSDHQVKLFTLDQDNRLQSCNHDLPSNFVAAHLFDDASGATQSLASTTAPGSLTVDTTEFQANRRPAASAAANVDAEDEDEVDYGDEMEDSAASQGMNQGSTGNHASSNETRQQLRLALITIEGSLELYSVTIANAEQVNTARLWRSNSILDLPAKLEGLSDPEKVIVCSDVSSTDLRTSWVGTLGDTLALVTIQSDGLLNAWNAHRVASSDGAVELVFKKSFSKILAKEDATLVPPNGEMQRRSAPGLVPADLRETLQDSTASALFLTHSQSGWLLKTRRGGLNFYPSSVNGIESFTMLANDSQGAASHSSSYVYSTRQGVYLASFPRLDFDLPIARSHFSSGRDYTHVRAYPPTRCLVAASTVNTPFVLFDTEEGEVVRDLNVDPTFALSKRGSLELFKHDWNDPIDGYEFDQNETVSALELLTLTSAGSLTGLREFIAVGTTVYNGEDRPTRGAMYIFEVVETVPDQAEPEINCRLKLLVRDDAGKGPVTALADISGYMAVAVGQKLFIRAFENHESLIHVAFLDTYYLTTSIRRLGSTLLLSDLHKSITFIGFQEEPFKLTIFAHDYTDSYSTTANYLLTEDSLAFISTDWKGSLRLLDYNVNTFNNSHYGSKLILKAEFQTNIEWTCSTSLAGRHFSGEVLATSNEILLGGNNGSIVSIRPITSSQQGSSEALFNTLNTIQNTLVRAVPHTAALNPRGHRIVKNEWLSKPLNKGVVDTLTLHSWLEVGRPKMVEIADSVKSSSNLDGPEGSAKNISHSGSEFRTVMKALQSVL